MITRLDIEERVREWGLREDVVEKDYVIGWVLWGIGRNPTLREEWAFKGGTCLKKCYIETYRFSEDLDFTVLPGGPVRPDDVQPHLLQVLNDVAENSGIDFNRREPLFKGHPSGAYTEGRIYYVGARVTPAVASVKLDLGISERVARPTVFRTISHPYPDEPDEPGIVRCYCFEEVFAEKIRAMGERGRPRDLYDVINLFRRQDLTVDPREIRAVLIEKCESKGVPVPNLESILTADTRAELESEWFNMLGHQLPQLPPLESFIEELAELFAWLEGTSERPALASVAPYASEEDAAWSAPPTTQTWGFGVPLEAIRFAAANHLCIDLGYGGTRRIIEPYALRSTRAGNLILHADRTDTGAHCSYRVDRIETATITDRTFVPRHAIEFSRTGPMNALPAYSLDIAARETHRRRTSQRSEPGYRIECPVCGKRFARSRPGNNRLNNHKAPDGYRCSGSGGYGYQV